MKVIKKINNNVAIGKDGNNREVIIFGKGIGFHTMPYELTDLSKIDRTFYDVDERYYKLFEEIDSDMFNYISHMVDIIQTKIPGHWDPYLSFILVDHIHFAIKRLKMNMKIGFPYSYEIETEFPEFNKYAKWMVMNINKKMNVHLEKGEITCIAMHLINSFEGTKKKNTETMNEKCSRILNNVVKIIEDYFDFKINRHCMNYYRFRYHIQYFVKRKEEHEEMIEENFLLFETVKEQYPFIYECVCEIEKYLEKEYKESCSKDELLYLMIHINRLYTNSGL